MRPTPDKMSAFLAQLKKKMNLKSLVVTLAAIVVFTTTYLLILPAFTLDKEEAIEQGGIDVVAEETAADADQAEETAEDVEEDVSSEVASEEAAAPETETVQTERAIQAEDSDKAEAAAKPDVKLLTKQKTITAEQAKDDDFEVSAVVGKDAKVPDDVTITATELNKETEDFDYDQYKKDALEALKKDSSDVKGVKSIKFYDISLESESRDDSVEPAAPVNVKIAYEDGMKVDDAENIRIVHFAEQENGEVKAEVLDKKENNVEAIVDNKESKLTEASFDAEGFSVYAIAEMELETEVTLPGSDDTYEVKVTFDEDAKIPEDAHLEVTTLAEDSQEYAEAKETVVDDKKAKGEEFDENALGFAALDISIKDEKGNTIEPAEGAKVRVSIKIKNLPEDIDEEELAESLEIQHLNESTGKTAVEIVAQPKDMKVAGGTAEAEFTIKSFSTFTITWGGATNNTTGNVRWRYNNNNTRGQITVRYVNEDGMAITRPSGVFSYQGNYDIAVSNNNFTNELVFSADNVAGTINNRTYQSAYIILDGVKTPVTRVVAARAGTYSYSMSYYNGNTLVHSASGTGATNYTRPDVYLQYSNTTSDPKATIHYGYMNGNTFVEFEDQPSPAEVTTSHHAYLIYDFDGYKYADHTYYRTSEATGNPATGGTEIQARLIYNNGNWQYRSNNWNNLANDSHIYVIYEAKDEATQGGTATTKPVEPGQEPQAPNIIKDSDPNGDGTNTLSLSVTGKTIDMEVEKLADVIVVFDVSGSMSRDISSNTDRGVTDSRSRMYQLKAAVRSLADTLLSEEYENSEGEKLIRMSLVTFSTASSSASAFTDDPDVFKGWVNSLGADGGTNWEQALYEANTASVDSERATFVIFVTDGEPTFRVSRMNVTDADLDINSKDNNDTYYLSDNVFGNGTTDPSDHNYDAALIEAQSIVSNGKNLYTIGVGPEVGNLTTFGNAAGASGNYTATSSDALVDAFDDIIAEISSLMGWGDIEITDGITGLTNTVEKSGLLNVDGNFEYWRAPAPANWSTMTDEQKAAYVPADSAFASWDPASENCLEAEYDEASGAVLWNMGDNFVPADGVTYKVTFKVWPKQEAYDILAALQNGSISYNDLDPKIKAQIDEDTLTLKTNEDDAGYSYRSATKTGNTVSVTGDPITGSFPPVDRLIMDTDEVTVAKTWDNKVDSTPPHDITLQVWGGGTLYKSFVLTEGNNWTASDGYISCGLMTVDESTGHVEVYETGHDFILKEVGDGSFYWDLIADTYHPMVINNERTTLILVDPDDVPSAMTGDFYKNGTDKYYKIDGSVYKYVSSASEGITLTAKNEHRTYVDLSKVVVQGENNTPVPGDTALFTYTITLNDSMGTENGNQGYLFFTVRDMAAGRNLDNTVVTTSADYYPVGGSPYFRVYTGEEFTLSIRQGWNVRFLNLPGDSTYSIEEQDKEDYEFVSISATAMSGGASVEIDASVDGQSVTGKVDKSNAGHTIQYMNRVEAREVKLLKTTENGKSEPLPGATFDLYTKAGYESVPKADPIKTDIVSSDESGKEGLMELGVIPLGDYYLVETAAPAGYNVLAEPVVVKVEEGKITIVQGSAQRQDSTPDDTIYDAYITNTSGTELPMTGGIGTTIFYILGSLLVVGCGIMLVSRRRTNTKK